MKAVLFDAGGTLVHIDYERVAGAVHRVLGRQVAVRDFIAAEYEARAAVEAGMAKGDLPTDNDRWSVHFRTMLASIGVGAEEFGRVAPEVMAEHQRKHLWTYVQPGTSEGLAALRQAGYLLGVISNADGRIEQLLEVVGLRRHFAFVVDSGAVGVEKPDARIFEIALARARETDPGLAAGQCYYVGDIHPIDVVGSRNVGMVPVLLDPLGRYGERGCRCITDVPTFCRELAATRAAA